MTFNVFFSILQSIKIILIKLITIYKYYSYARNVVIIYNMYVVGI